MLEKQYLGSAPGQPKERSWIASVDKNGRMLEKQYLGSAPGQPKERSWIALMDKEGRVLEKQYLGSAPEQPENRHLGTLVDEENTAKHHPGHTTGWREKWLLSLAKQGEKLEVPSSPEAYIEQMGGFDDFWRGSAVNRLSSWQSQSSHAQGAWPPGFTPPPPDRMQAWLNAGHDFTAEIPRLTIPAIPAPAFAAGGSGGTPSALEANVVRHEIVINGKGVGSVLAPREQIKGMVDSIKETLRGLP